MNKKTLKDIDVRGKKVLVRCDFNVPMNSKRQINDDNRIVGSLPSIEYLIENDAKIILMSHLGRPKGQASEKYSLEPVAKRLEELLDREVIFAQDDNVVSDKVKETISNMKEGQIVLLENTRFRAEETENGGDFAEELASLADIFVNDAFGTSHRAHASNVGVSSLIPSALGFLVEKEMELMGKTLENPEKPFIAILGGAKVSDKIGVIENLLDKADTILICGGMSYTFLKTQGYEIGTSLVEDDKLELAKDLLRKADQRNVDLLIPVDIVVASEFSNDSEFKTVDIDKMPADMMGLDIGKKTIDIFVDKIKEAKTVVWNGPCGVFEYENFSKGTYAVAKAMAESEGITIVGGGDSASAVEKAGYKDRITHVSTGGGASLELLEGKTLPGIDIITNK